MKCLKFLIALDPMKNIIITLLYECVTHLNDTVYDQVKDNIDNKEDEYGSGYSLILGTDINTTADYYTQYH